MSERVHEGMIGRYDLSEATLAEVQAYFERYQRQHPDEALTLEYQGDYGAWTPFGRYTWHIVRTIHELP